MKGFDAPRPLLCRLRGMCVVTPIESDFASPVYHSVEVRVWERVRDQVARGVEWVMEAKFKC